METLEGSVLMMISCQIASTQTMYKPHKPSTLIRNMQLRTELVFPHSLCIFSKRNIHTVFSVTRGQFSTGCEQTGIVASQIGSLIQVEPTHTHTHTYTHTTQVLVTYTLYTAARALDYITKQLVYYRDGCMVASIIDVWGYDREFCSSPSSSSTSVTCTHNRLPSYYI